MDSARKVFSCLLLVLTVRLDTKQQGLPCADEQEDMIAS